MSLLRGTGAGYSAPVIGQVSRLNGSGISSLRPFRPYFFGKYMYLSFH